MPLLMLLEWWNLIYLVPFGLALIYLALFVFTGITFGEADADADLDADADTTVHVEAHVVDVDGDVDADHDVGDGDASHDTDAAGGRGLGHLEPDMHTAGHHTSQDHGRGTPSLLAGFLAFLGVGKIPLSLAVMILLLTWGIVGFCANAILFRLVSPVLVGFISLPITFILSLAMTGAAAALIGRVIPVADSRGQRREDLVGKTGDAIYDIDATFGMASVRNASGDLFQVPCQTVDGARIPKGARVVLFDYDREKGVFRVAPFAT